MSSPVAKRLTHPVWLILPVGVYRAHAVLPRPEKTPERVACGWGNKGNSRETVGTRFQYAYQAAFLNMWGKLPPPAERRSLIPTAQRRQYVQTY